jgi:hypothetical protein
MCISNSSSVKPSSAASVVAHNCVVLLMSSSGGGGGPLRFRSGFELDESTDVDDSFSRLMRPRGPLLRPSDDGRGERSPAMCMEGRMSFFCFDAGRISSRSTGTPSETRNSRRMRERTQSGGWSGGGATSCVHNEWLLSERKIDRVSSGFVDMVGMLVCEG